MPTQILINPLPNQTFRAVLGGQNCTLRLRQCGGRMFLDLNVDGQDICQGALCQNRAAVVRPFPPHFSGSLHFIDLEGDRPPEYAQIGTRYFLLYFGPDEAIPERLRY